MVYFKDSNPVSAYPSAGLNIPFYILGSSTESAYLAAELGLPYAFASHFAPRMMEMAVEIYRKNFKPSTYLAEPYVILGVNAGCLPKPIMKRDNWRQHKHYFS